MEISAWDILTKEEKTALSLSINHNKSSWEAGEILKKAHYKYLEIHARARHFFKIFTLYLEETEGEIIPRDSQITWDFQEFILCTIQDRKGYRETLKIIGKESPLGDKKASVRNHYLLEYMNSLKDHKDPLHRGLHDLILEFDRWNNFRILPEVLQEPSAFKRRNKTRLLKHLKNTQNLEPFLIDKIHNRCKAPLSYKRKVCYLPIVNGNNEHGYEVIKVKHKSDIIKYISTCLNLYVFPTQGLADDYGFLVDEYLTSKNRHCRLGQTFWPKFRVLIKDAINYNQVNNIIPRRVNLEDAIVDLDKAKVKKAKVKKTKDGDPQNREKDTKFWDI